MADAATTETEQSIAKEVKVEEAGPARKRLVITVPPEAIADRMEDSIGTLMNEANLPGFRKGRAPRQLIERKFGSALRNETKNQIIADAYSSAIEEQSITPVGEPEPVEKLDDIELEDGKPLSFSVEVEVVPEFELPDLSEVEIKKPTVEITDEHIENELERQLYQLGQSEQIESDFKAGDRIVGSARVYKNDEDEPFFNHEQVLINHPGDEDGGKGQVLGLLIDGLAGMLAGKKVGDELEIETVGPEAHENEDIRGAKLRIHFSIHAAERVHPATKDQLIEQFGLGNEENLREQIRLALDQRLEQEQANAMREQLYDKLDELVELELPEKLSASQAQRAIDRQRIEMLYRGVSPEEVEDRLAEIRADSEQAALRRLKLSFILQRLAQEFSIQVSEQEINGRISAMAMQRGERPDKLRNELAKAGRLDSIAMQIREHKTADRAIEQAKVEEISSEEWQKLMEENQASESEKE